MIDFPKNYFDEEERCNFKISHMMKCAWAAQIEVLLVIEEICKRHNLKYYAYFGTLLGAVRHKGFIPWDDDMDIAMKREDYILFFLYAKEELPEGYRILNPYADNEWEESFSRIVNSDKIDASEERMVNYHGCPFAVGIDIFPLDYLPKNEQIRNMQKKMLEMAKNCHDIIAYISKYGEKDLGEDGTYKEALAENIKKLSDFTGIKRETGISLNTWILRMFDAICMMGNGQNADTIGSFQIQISKILTDEIKKEALETTIRMSFETVTIEVPIGYDEALTNVYGKYRKLQFTPSHEYPFYKKQIALIQGKHIWNEEELNQEMNRNLENCRLDYYGERDAEIPDEWAEKIKEARGKGKIVILFGTSIVDFMMKELEYINMLQNSLREIRENREKIMIWWRPDKISGYIYFYKHPEIEKKYNECIQYFMDNNLGIIDQSKELIRAVNRTDAYWGDETIAYNRCVQSGKNVWLQEDVNLNIILNKMNI